MRVGQPHNGWRNEFNLMSFEGRLFTTKQVSRTIPAPWIWKIFRCSSAIALLAGFWGAQGQAQSLSSAGRQQRSAGWALPQPLRDGTVQFAARYNPDQTLRVTFGLKRPHPDEEEELLQQLYTKDSPLFHRFLTTDEWIARFAPSPEDEQKLVEWVQSQGLTITSRYPNRLLINAEAPVSRIERGLNVRINNYRSGSNTFFSNDRDPVLPVEVDALIDSVQGLNNLAVVHPASSNTATAEFPDYSPGPASEFTMSRQTNAKSQTPRARSSTANGVIVHITSGGYDPTDLYSSQAYNLDALDRQGHCCNPLHKPDGSPPETSIAVATFGAVDMKDLDGFTNQYSYLAMSVHMVNVDGKPSCCDSEGTMDAEWATAMANSFGYWGDTAAVWIYQGASNSTSTFIDVFNRILSDGKVRVVTVSWGCSEDCWGKNAMNTLHGVLNQMVGQGYTIVVAAGDNGAVEGCGSKDKVLYPASDTNVIAAGGTTLVLDGAGKYSDEVAWTGATFSGACNTNNGGGGGGVSSYWKIPYYQKDAMVGDATYRTIPDLALNASSMQNVYFQSSLQGSGGTSIVAPELAGFFAQVNAYLLSLGNVCGGSASQGTSPCAPMGNANFAIYWEGGHSQHPSAAGHYPFYDITSGCNSNDVTAARKLNSYCAAAGYDMATGWGSGNMLQLAWTINNFYAGDLGKPAVTFHGPLTNRWFNSEQIVSWTVAEQSGTVWPGNGVAGFSQAWDSAFSDAYSKATPGTGDYFYSGPQFPNATSGFLKLTWAGGQGCHTANVQAWNNAGKPSVATYGPICYDTIAPVTAGSLSGNRFGVTVTLSASDSGSDRNSGSGVYATYFAVDKPACAPGNKSACSTYQGPFGITTQTSHTVYFFSQDNAGNVESQKTLGISGGGPTL
jgi:subtilase family serine protease